VNIVAIETATETVGAAVRTEGGARAVFTLGGKRRHVETLAPALEHLLAQVGLAASDLDVVAVDLGPGLFTGLRVGVAAAKGLAQALGIGVVGLSSLDILSRAALELGHQGYVLAAVDARRGEVFASVRELRPGVTGTKDVVAPGLFAPPELAEVVRELGGMSIVGVGDGVQRYADVFDAVPGVTCVLHALESPPPFTLLRMASELSAGGVPPVDAANVRPIYMREADAKSNFAQVRSN